MNRITSFRVAGLGLVAAMLVAALAVVMVATPALAASAALRIDPSTQTVAQGASGTFKIKHNVTGDAIVTGISGSQATITFDQTKIQLTSVTRGADWTGSSLLPNPIATAIANANTTGTLPQLAVFFSPGTSVALGDHDMVTIGFNAVACGSVPLGLSGIEVLDQDGSLVPSTSANGDIQITCPVVTPTPAPATPTPEPTTPPTPGPIPPSSGTTNVSGTVPAGFINMTVPSEVTIPLERETINTADVGVNIDSNTLWQLNVNDPKVPNKGFMTDGAKVLKQSMRVQSGSTQIDLRFGGLLASGAGDNLLTAQLRQQVVPADPPGNYSISVQFQTVAGF